MSRSQTSDNLYLKRLTCSWRSTGTPYHGQSVVFGPSADSTAPADIPDPRASSPQQRVVRLRPPRQQISFENTVAIQNRFINANFEMANDGFPKRLLVHEDIGTCGVYLTGFTLRRSCCGRKLSSSELTHVIAPVLGKLDLSDMSFGCSVFQSGFQSAFYKPLVRPSERNPKKVFRVFNEGWFSLIVLLPQARCGLRAVQDALNNLVWNDTVIQARCCPLGSDMITKLFDESRVSFSDQLISRGDTVSSRDVNDFYAKQKQESSKRAARTCTERDTERLKSMINTSGTFITKIASFKLIREEMYRKGLLERDKKIEEMRRRKLEEERAEAERLALLKKKEEEERALNAPLLSQPERTSLDSSIKGFL